MKKPSIARRSSDVSVTVALSTLMIAVAVVLAVFLVQFNFQRNRDAAMYAAEDMLNALSEQIEERVLSIVRPIVSIAELTPELVPIGVFEGSLKPGFRAFLTRIVERFPQVDSVYMGFDDGAFFRIASLRAYSAEYRRTKAVPPTATIAQFTLAPVGDTPELRETVRYLDANGAAIGSPRSGESDFDPRTRPWYGDAMRAEGVIGTLPYRFASSGQVGFTAARRLFGESAGVLGVDLTLADLSDFLASQRPTLDSRLYLFTEEGKVLASADSATDHAADEALVGPSEGVPSLSDFSDPFAAMLRAQQLGNGELPTQLELEGRTMVVRRTKLVGPLGKTSYFGIVVPADHFTGRITELGRNSALISVLFILAMVPLIALASRAFSRPLQNLAVEAEAIRQFQLEGPVEVTSRVREIQALSASMERMKGALRTFGIYVPRDLVRQMVARSSPPKLGGERLEITLLFTDIQGFTPIADGLEPELLMQRMSTYFETATMALRQHGGTIDKFMGDAVMAMWNPLGEEPDHAVRGCRGALAARDALAELSARLVADGLEPMPTRFGLHTGVAVVGNVGSSERMNFTALGATVNLAARLEPLNKVFGTEILVSEHIAQYAHEHFHLRSVAVVKPKGVMHPLRVYELLAEKGSADEFAWIADWERAFDAYLAGDFRLARQQLECLPGDRAADPVHGWILRRIAAVQGDPRKPAWDPIESF